ncbi:hypothetical protein [Litorimonas haliclonae]|uniref:hypothetical protein n=1 Tax=Litorimonas haliclonae TaxID=2081977 RepID=UPI0039EEE534
MKLREKLLQRAENYCTRNGITLSTLSSRLANDGKVLPSLKTGKDLTTGRYEAITSQLDGLERDEVPQ